MRKKLECQECIVVLYFSLLSLSYNHNWQLILLKGRLSATRMIASRATPTGGPTMVVFVLKLQCIFHVVWLYSKLYYQTMFVFVLQSQCTHQVVFMCSKQHCQTMVVLVYSQYAFIKLYSYIQGNIILS